MSQALRVAVLSAMMLSCGGGSRVMVDSRPPAAPAPQSQPPSGESAARSDGYPGAVPEHAWRTSRRTATLEPVEGTAPGAAEPAEQEDGALRVGGFDPGVFHGQQPPLPVGFDAYEEPALAPDDVSLLDEIAEESIPEDYSISEVRLERLRRTESELPLTLNDDVLRMVNYFTGPRGSKTLRATLGRSGAYKAMIERILEEEDVPAEIFHLAQAESGFRPQARSHAHATGMWQFMAFRGKQYGLRQDRYVEERFDAEKATRAAARHLKDLYIEFGDWYLAFAAYNSGPGRVDTAIKRGGTRDYWELCQKRLLPRETRNYVPIILAFAYVTKNLDMYDIGTIDWAPPQRYDTAETESEISLELIADITGSSVTELEQLNQALLRSATPPYSYALRLPEGSAGRFAEEIALVPEDKRLNWRRHEVRRGESLDEIAQRYKADKGQLIAVNGFGEDAGLEAGLRLNVPTTTPLRQYRSAVRTAGGFMESGSNRYRIARGDTLGGIARRFGVSVAQLRQWNGLASTRITAGRYLIVRPEGGGAVSAGLSPDGVYSVRRGDTLSAIARRFGATVAQIQAWNSLSGTRIHVGQNLKVPSLSSPEPAPAPAAVASAPQPPAGSGTDRYRIRPGDTLGGIADRFGVTAADLRAWNGLRGSTIRAGDYLTVRPREESAPAPSAAPAARGGVRQYRVQRGDSLIAIAERHGVTADQLKSWNGLRGSRIQAGQSLIVGYGAPPEPASNTAAAFPAPAPSSAERYRIQRGDSLAGIARKFAVSVAELQAWNGLSGSQINAGDELVVRRQAASASAGGAASAAGNPGVYVVRSGDTLGAIAERFGVTAADLRAWNSLRGSRIDVGQKLVTRAPQASGGQYKVRPGDTLEVIARRFNVSVDDLKTWNGLNSSIIRAGDTLTVRPSQS